jgi:membrane associated rhomboid family serine protease
MGLYDRDYYQDDDSSAGNIFSTRPRNQKMMVTNIVIVTVAFWIADNLGEPGWLSNVLALRADLFAHPLSAYQVITHGLTHAQLGESWGIMHILFNMLVLWMFGRELEWKYGAIEFLRFYLIAIVFSGLVWLGAQYAIGREGARLVGASGGVAAVLFLFIMNFPQRTLYLWGILGMPAWLLGAIYIVGELFFFISPGEARVAHEAHLAGAAFGAAYFQFGWSFSRIFSRSGRDLFSRFKSRPKLKVHDPETYYQDLDSEADALLAKIHRQGEDSLTHEERKKLEDYARRMRQKHR